MKCRSPQACPFWSLPNNVKRQLYWTVLLNACSLFKYCLMMLVVVSWPLKLPAGSSYATFKGLWFCYLCYRVCPASIDMCWVSSRFPTFDVWGISATCEPLVGSQLKPALLSQRPEFFEQRELEDLHDTSLVITYRFLMISLHVIHAQVE